MKSKKTTRKSLKTKLDKLASLSIRQIEEECVQCLDEGVSSRTQLGAGHIFGRGSLATRWDLTPDGNVHTQCWAHNFKHVRDQYPYFNWYIKKFGQEAFDNLRRRHDQETHYKDWELQERINTWET